MVKKRPVSGRFFAASICKVAESYASGVRNVEMRLLDKLSMSPTVTRVTGPGENAAVGPERTGDCMVVTAADVRTWGGIVGLVDS